MDSVKRFSTEVAGRNLEVEIGKLALQAHAACTVRYGDTVVLATVVAAPEPRDGVDYFPLVVDYEERMYAAGKIKGSRFIKREGRANDDAILVARLVDRSIRPLFKETTRKDVQVVLTVLSIDMVNDPDIPALLAASIALSISPVPWTGPLAGVRVGRINGEWVLNGTSEARLKSDFDLILAGTAEGAIMIEAEGQQIPEADFFQAIAFGHKHLKKIIEFINDIAKQVGKPKTVEVVDEETQVLQNLVTAKVHEFLSAKDLSAVFKAEKTATQIATRELKEELNQILKADNEVNKDARALGLDLFEEALAVASQKMVLEKNIRADGRGLDDLRSLSAEVGLLPRTHGSGLFTRGETQVLSIVTLGAPGDEQVLDTMEESGKKRYMHHYNFPGYAVGEVKPMRSPSRREIGHGALAEKALEPVLPAKEDFPYTIRVVSEVLSSNGSSSQASVCGSTLALMDTGVPIKAPVAGVAMGLIQDKNNLDNYRVLTDIQGLEDHAGDMDFKVAGTEQGITAIQLDIKLGYISLKIVEETLQKAKIARDKILAVMKQAIPAPRAELSQYAPRIITLRIDPEKIRDVIGSGGKIINGIIDATGVEIDIEDDGLVMITAIDAAKAEEAKQWVIDLTSDVEVGAIVEGTVTKIVSDKIRGNEIGAIVEFGRGKDGMVHISELKYERVPKVSDILHLGDKVTVKVVSVDKENNRISLSLKAMSPKPDNYQEEDSRPPRSNGPRGPHKPRFFGH